MKTLKAQRFANRFPRNIIKSAPTRLPINSHQMALDNTTRYTNPPIYILYMYQVYVRTVYWEFSFFTFGRKTSSKHIDLTRWRTDALRPSDLIVIRERKNETTLVAALDILYT